MSKGQLIIFVKNPEKGKVKTRLAKTVGDDKALAVYKSLLRHTETVTQDLPFSKKVFYSQKVEEGEHWNAASYLKAAQQGKDLGNKIQHAFQDSFDNGFKSVIIIGSDCPELQTTHLIDAFHQLKSHDVVIGPAVDGGYYLLGMNQLHADFFKNKNWSTETVLSDTIKDISALKLSYHLLPELSDVDYEEDLIRLMKGTEVQ